MLFRVVMLGRSLGCPIADRRHKPSNATVPALLAEPLMWRRQRSAKRERSWARTFLDRDDHLSQGEGKEVSGDIGLQLADDATAPVAEGLPVVKGAVLCGYSTRVASMLANGLGATPEATRTRKLPRVAARKRNSRSALMSHSPNRARRKSCLS